MTAYTNDGWKIGDPAYTLNTRVPGGEFDDVVKRTVDALKQEGFGVLTEIDLQKTMKEKLNLDLPRYLILGACNPPLAHEAVSQEPGIGALLPCNVVVAEEADGIYVGAIHPSAMFSVVQKPEVEPLAQAVTAKLKRALDALN